MDYKHWRHLRKPWQYFLCAFCCLIAISLRLTVTEWLWSRFVLASCGQTGDVHCSFLMAKARLGPVKTVSIPRLELLAATQAVKIDQIVRNEMLLAWASAEIFPEGATSTFCLSFSGCYQCSGVRRNFHGGFIQCRMLVICSWCVCDDTVWRHIHISTPTFWRSLLTQYAYFSTRTLLTLCAIVLNINYQRSKLGYRRKIHSTLRHSSW